MNAPEAGPLPHGQRAGAIRAVLERAFAPQSLDVRDDSHRHVGHAGARDGRGHFSIDIVSRAFAGLSPVERHRAVYSALAALMQTDIHALSIRATTPAD